MFEGDDLNGLLV